MSEPPELHIIIPYDGEPRFYVQAETEGEELRLEESLEANPRAWDLFEAAERWYEPV